MKTPAFWNSKNILSTALLPLANLYDIGSTLLRANIRPATLPATVICIGNVTAGGSGKTPVALHIGRMMKNKNLPAFFLSRGYGGKMQGPVLVNPEKHSASDVGDEPLLLAKLLPTVVAKNRIDGGLKAIQKGAKIIIMDDGFQNPSLAKSLSLLVIDGTIGFGNGRLLPAGPLRELPENALRRAHAVIIINRTNILPKLPPDKPVFFARTEPTQEALLLRGKKIVAFCGLAYPHKFFDMLNSIGAQMCETVSFPDHYAYTKKDIRKLIMRAQKHHAVLVTTNKDAVRIPETLREAVYAAGIDVVFDDEAGLDGILDFILSKTHEKN